MLGANHIPEQGNQNNTTNASLTLNNNLELNSTYLEDNNAFIVRNNDSVPIVSEKEEDDFVCALYNPDFIIYSSIGSFYIPCIVMIYLYARIFKVGIFLIHAEAQAWKVVHYFWWWCPYVRTKHTHRSKS